MDAERARAFLLTLPHVVETMQWGENLVFWVGDKVLGGKMFALMNLDSKGGPVLSFAAGHEHAAELCEREGLRPAPYLARAGWVAAERWEALANREWQEEFSGAHKVVLARLAQRTAKVLSLPAVEREQMIVERRETLSERRITLSAKAAAGKRPRP